MRDENFHFAVVRNSTLSQQASWVEVPPPEIIRLSTRQTPVPPEYPAQWGALPVVVIQLQPSNNCLFVCFTVWDAAVPELHAAMSW